MGLLSWLFGGNKKQAEETPQESLPTSEVAKEAALAEPVHTPETKSESKPASAPTALPDVSTQKTTELLLMKLKARYPKGLKCSSQWKLMNKLINDGEYEINDLRRKADDVCKEEQGMDLEEYLEQNGMMLRIWPSDYQELDKLFVKYAGKTFQGSLKALKAANKDVNWAAIQRIADVRNQYVRNVTTSSYVLTCTPIFYSGNFPITPEVVNKIPDLQKMVDSFFAELAQAFPDKVVQFAANDYSEWFLRIREMRCELKYPSSGAFLADYGYTYIPPEGSTECFETRETEPAPDASKPDAQETAAVTPPPQPKAKETQQAEKAAPAAQEASPKKNSSAAKEAGTPVKIGEDLTILVPAGMRWSTDETKNGGRQLVFMKTQGNKFYKEWVGNPVHYDFENPFAAPQCLTLLKAAGFSTDSGGVPDLSNPKIHSTLKDAAETLLGSALVEDPHRQPVIVQDDKNIINGYMKAEDNNTMFVIVTPTSFYHGQIFINDTADADARHKLIEDWLGNMCSGADDGIRAAQAAAPATTTQTTQPQATPGNAFAVPTYKQKQRTSLDELSVPVPDGMHVLSDSSDTQKISQKDRELLEEAALVIVPKGFKKGFSSYKDAPFSVRIGRSGIQQVDGADALWLFPLDMRQKYLTNILDQNLQNMDATRVIQDHVIEFKELGPQLDAVYSQVGEGPDWCSYIACFLCKNMFYQVMIYINAEKDKAAFHKAVEKWIFGVTLK